MREEPMIPEIQRYCVNDGPGIRTLIFFKGCFLHCPWCHNPEYISPDVDLYFHEDKCVRCGRCVEACPAGAISPVGSNGEPPLIDKKKCEKHYKCIEVCPEKAREKVSSKYNFEGAVREAISDKSFYDNSGGGVTISGGEPMFFPEYTLRFAKRFKKESINVAVETSASCKWELIDKVADYVDLFLIDIKNMDAEKLKEATGADSKAVLENIERLSEKGVKIIIRVPVIPGFNDNTDNFEKMAQFLIKLKNPVEKVDILPFHNSGEKKYKQLGLNYKYEGVPFMEASHVDKYAEILTKYNIKAVIGGL